MDRVQNQNDKPTHRNSVDENIENISSSSADNEILGNEILGNEILGNEILGNEILGNEILGNVKSDKSVVSRTNHSKTDATYSVGIAEVRRDAEVISFIRSANEALRALGYTEHGQRHAGLVGNIAANILERLGYDERSNELANIAGYLHDIGNSIHRENHALSGSLMAWRILTRMGMQPEESALIMNAIGNHEEERGLATNAVSAALIIADKSDVHRSRVQNPDMATFDIHDRVNYAATRSFVRVRQEEKVIALELQIDTEYAQVIEYFEIFLSRMTMVRQAVQFLGCEFQLIINDTRFS